VPPADDGDDGDDTPPADDDTDDQDDGDDRGLPAPAPGGGCPGTSALLLTVALMGVWLNRPRRLRR